MIKQLFFSILFIIFSFQGFANESVNTKRIQSLLPKGITLNIDPHIPSDFILVQDEPLERNFFWMPEGLYEKYMANPKLEHRPFIQVIVMDKPDGNKDKNYVKNYVEEMRNQFPVHSSSLHWGDFEVTPIKMKPTDDDEYMAFVDLNKSDGKFVIFHFVYHKRLDYGNGNQPSKEDLDFWNNFLHKTKSF